MMRASRGKSEQKTGGVILLFLFLVLSLATLHGGCAGVAGSSNPGGPTVTITSPTSGTTISASITLSANASTNAVGVQFKLDGGNLGSEVTAAPYSISWDTTTATNGAHTLIAVARNAAGQTAPSAPVTITVQNSSGGGPSVSITSPTSGATVSASTTVSANALANAVGVQFKLDGANLGSETTSVPFSISWDTTTTANGQHTLTAVARNAAGQTATSAPVTITVQNSSGGNPPVISGVSASPGSTSATIFWATDVASDSQVDYGTTVSYGQSSPLDSTQVTSHSASLSRLASSTLYHFRVKSKDSSGRMTISSDSTFTTLQPGAEGSLSTLAASMAPGTWVVLNREGDGSGYGSSLLDAGGGNNIFQFASKAAWDPIARHLYFVGQGHLSNRKFIDYEAATNAWTVKPKPFWDCSPSPSCFWHAYEHNTVNPRTGDFFVRDYNSKQVYKYDPATGSWSSLPVIPDSVLSNNQVAGAIEFFPDMGTQGGIVFVDAWGICFFNLATNTWSKLLDLPTMGQYQNFGSYNPIAKVVIFGGGEGSSDIYKLDSAGVITKMRNAPIALGVLSSVVTPDPVSGKYLVLGAAGAFYEYDVVADAWRLLSVGAVPVFVDALNFEIVAAPVRNYGVNMFLTWNSQQSKVYLYKHTGP